MKKLLYLLLLLPALAFSQVDEYTPLPAEVYASKGPTVIPFSTFNGSATDYELPYLRYCLKQSSNFRIASYCFTIAAAAAAATPLFYTQATFRRYDSPFEDYDDLLQTTRIGAIGLGAAGIITGIISESWFRQSTIKPFLSQNGVGITLRIP